ncbi:hypothetical protein AKJ36_00010 [candidate division MSBL1 archaeon SCGC-AAA259I07]|uniref:Uncharacterized protein n=1 Tax=candidate division MSBL1 archaeon SCGC-AAA259I07 TaxID=1698266 RepID=A0A133UMU1_9EURY|nr:hypothetical protein AKJ36_00010 [candidate division MSBL1 archaeon SCGC-AAA259I07]
MRKDGSPDRIGDELRKICERMGIHPSVLKEGLKVCRYLTWLGENSGSVDEDEFNEVSRQLRNFLEEKLEEEGKSPPLVVGSVWATLLGIEKASRSDDGEEEVNRMFH